ncbi:hypothetical protein H0H93_008350 [Arthromyces matolae]|nr:hypothetical protein H0H93_008350 [Arthromyces matolae]
MTSGVWYALRRHFHPCQALPPVQLRGRPERAARFNAGNKSSFGRTNMPDTQKVVADRVEDAKELYSVGSGSTATPPLGIDAEVAEFFAQAPSDKPIVIDDATNVRLRWMVHKRVLVVMVLTYFAQTLDKGTMNFASIMGIVKDTKLVGQQYAWLTTCAHSLAWEFPTNRLIQRLPIGKYLGFKWPCSIMAWGAVLATTAACKNVAGLVVVRTLLGIFESTMWYTREEQALVIGAFYSMNGFQQCVGGLIAYGIAHIEHAKLKNWQILFTLLGCITFVWGIFVIWWLPDSPMRAKCWSKEDRLLIAERVRKNETGIQNREFKVYQAVEGLLDPTVWAVVLISFTNALPTGGLGAFSNLIITAFGYTQLQTYLLAIAQGAIIMTFLFSATYISKRLNQKLLLAFIYTLPNIAGTIVFLFFRANDAPRYMKAFIAHIVVYGIQLATIVFLRLRLMRLNALKRRAQNDANIAHKQAFSDLTDGENPDFRYTY